jgi:hypothetical protein
MLQHSSSTTSLDKRRRVITKRRLGGVAASSSSSASSSSPACIYGDGGSCSGDGEERQRRVSLARTVSNKSDDGIDYGDGADIDDRDGNDDIDNNNNNNNHHGSSSAGRRRRLRRDSSRHSNSAKKKTTPWRIVALRLFRLETTVSLKSILFILLFPLCLYQVFKHSSAVSSWPIFDVLLFNSNKQHRLEPLALYGRHARMLQYYSADGAADDVPSPAAATVLQYEGGLRGGSNNIMTTTQSASRSRSSHWIAVDNQGLLLDNATTLAGATHTTYRNPSYLTMISDQKRNALRNGTFYEAERYALPPWETKHCRAAHAWQKATFLNCNTLHELPLAQLGSSNNKNNKENNETVTRILSAGYYRDVWVVPNHYSHHHDETQSHYPNAVILKSIRFKHNFEPDQFDRNRRDGMF